MFQFEDKPERDRVLVTQPWHFNGVLLALQPYDGIKKPESIVFDTCPFWVRIFDLPPIMMTEKIGAAVGSVIGPVLEVDHQWGSFIRIRVLVDVTKPLVDNSVVSSPYGDRDVEFRYEDMPDICLVCRQFDHLSENECPTAIEMRLNHGVVIKKCSIRIKAESPRFKNKRLDGNDGSFRLGGSGSRRQPPLSARSGTVRQSMGGGRGGRVAQISSSVGDSRRHIRQHVDNLIVRGKQVAQALGSEAVSCEVLSRFPRRVVEQNSGREKSGEAVERIVEAAANFAKEVDELYGDLGLPDSQGVRRGDAVGEDCDREHVVSKNRGVGKEPIYAAVSTTNSSCGNHDFRLDSRMGEHVVANFGLVSNRYARLGKAKRRCGWMPVRAGFNGLSGRLGGWIQ
ncbi:hypothetical protein COLO4_33502 [Corchorus olitorius]|uniref:DUF4283 domain-containing protein n=1 Tax=Corchorus olitorius TaxID=93759 RepID=A0A1R3GT33_9ROSI|nr:hypothetical protein COLO4_33502 [Corchorus olitorius]